MAMGAAFHEEAGYAAEFPFDPVSFAHTIASLAPAGLVMVAEIDGEVVGMGAIDVAPVITNHHVSIAREVFWYVRPQHRKGIGRKMFNALELLASNHGADFFDAVAEEGKRSAALARIYRAASLNPAEIVFRKRLRQCPSAPSLAA
jgi:GNAT superfamily N-acetyltransferase